MAKLAAGKIKTVNGVRVAKKIDLLETNNYDVFIVDPTLNRELRLLSAKYKNLKKSISEKGTNVDPIKVTERADGKYVIADGQHRFHALKELGLPVQFIVNEKVDISEIISMESSRSAHGMFDFVGIGKNREYKPFVLVYNLTDNSQRRVALTAIFETVFSYAVNEGKFFHRERFTRACNENMDIALKTYNVPVFKQTEEKILSVIAHMEEYAVLLEQPNLRPFIASELLHYALLGSINGAPMEDVLDFLKKEEVSRYSNVAQLSRAHNTSECRDVFREVSRIVNDKAENKKRKKTA